MASNFFLVLLTIHTTYTTEISIYIDCYDNAGNIPTGQGSDTDSYATCPEPYSVTSCGIIPTNNGDTELNRVYLQYTYRCNSNSPGIITNQVIARCCNLTDYGSSFTKRYSPPSSIATKSCTDNEEVIGCTINLKSGIFGGAFVGSLIDYNIANTSFIFDTENSCTAMPEASGGSVWAYAMCYDTSAITDGYKLNCVSTWGPKSNETDTASSTVSCPNDKDNYFMSSCTGYSLFGDVKSYTVINDTCTVTEKDNATYVIANAICCRMAKNITKPTLTMLPTTTIATTSHSSVSDTTTYITFDTTNPTTTLSASTISSSLPISAITTSATLSNPTIALSTNPITTLLSLTLPDVTKRFTSETAPNRATTDILTDIYKPKVRIGVTPVMWGIIIAIICIICYIAILLMDLMVKFYRNKQNNEPVPSVPGPEILLSPAKPQNVVLQKARSVSSVSAIPNLEGVRNDGECGSNRERTQVCIEHDEYMDNPNIADCEFVIEDEDEALPSKTVGNTYNYHGNEAEVQPSSTDYNSTNMNEMEGVVMGN